MDSPTKQERPLRVAVLAPLFYPIPPTKYGGTERVVAYLVDELHRMGHQVTLYALDGSKTPAPLVCHPGEPLNPKPLTHTIIEEMRPAYCVQLDMVMADIDKYDIVHVHQGILPFQPKALAKWGKAPLLWTDHTELFTENKGETMRQLKEVANVGLTSISLSQRDILTGRDFFSGTVFNGIPRFNVMPIPAIKPSYLAFLGRIAPEKGPIAAAQIAYQAGLPLKVAAKVESIHEEFWLHEVKPHFEKIGAESFVEIAEHEKSEFLSGAIALIFPIAWKEPFGLVMIEAMAAGTPVIAFRQGAVPEVVEEGVTGFVVDSVEEAVQAIAKVPTLSRKKIRAEFDKRFTAEAMAEKYVEVYRWIVDGKPWEEVVEKNGSSGVNASNGDTNGSSKASNGDSNGSGVPQTPSLLDL